MRSLLSPAVAPARTLARTLCALLALVAVTSVGTSGCTGYSCCDIGCGGAVDFVVQVQSPTAFQDVHGAAVTVCRSDGTECGHGVTSATTDTAPSGECLEAAASLFACSWRLLPGDNVAEFRFGHKESGHAAPGNVARFHITAADGRVLADDTCAPSFFVYDACGGPTCYGASVQVTPSGVTGGTCTPGS